MTEQLPEPEYRDVGTRRSDASIFAGVIGDIDDFFPVQNSEIDRKPWHQLPGESNTWFLRFLIYLNLGPTRAVSVAMFKDKERLGLLKRDADGNPVRGRRTNGSWYVKAAEMNWRERAQKWDIELIRRERALHEKAVKDARVRHTTLAKNMQVIGNKVLKLHDNDSSLKKVKPVDAAKMIVEGAKLELLALNRPTEIIAGLEKEEIQQPVINYDNYTLEELVVLKTLLERQSKPTEPRQAEVVVASEPKALTP